MLPDDSGNTPLHYASKDVLPDSATFVLEKAGPTYISGCLHRIFRYSKKSSVVCSLFVLMMT